MATNNNIPKNFGTVETKSYVGTNENEPIAKLVKPVTGDMKLVSPMAWSFAETHSYVSVTPAEAGIKAPKEVDEIYAKAVYLLQPDKDPVTGKPVGSSFVTVDQMNEALSNMRLAIFGMLAGSNNNISIGNRIDSNNALNNIKMNNRTDKNNDIIFGDRI